uniref:Protein RER1 n=1 Tax=Dromaius novaehollandiae TaxID=8790 RepID=A0A8C4KL00_DRONO
VAGAAASVLGGGRAGPAAKRGSGGKPEPLGWQLGGEGGDPLGRGCLGRGALPRAQGPRRAQWPLPHLTPGRPCEPRCRALALGREDAAGPRRARLPEACRKACFPFCRTAVCLGAVPGPPDLARMSEGDSIGESVHGKPSMVYRFFTRLGQIYQSWLDKSTPYTAVRWIVTLGLSFIYMIRVYLLQMMVLPYLQSKMKNFGLSLEGSQSLNSGTLPLKASWLLWHVHSLRLSTFLFFGQSL